MKKRFVLTCRVFSTAAQSLVRFRITANYFIDPKRVSFEQRRVSSKVTHEQCDQIGRFIGLWVTFQSRWQQIICPNLLHS